MFVRGQQFVIICLAVALVMAAQCDVRPIQPASQTSEVSISADHGRELGPVSLKTGEKLRVVATTNIVADLTRQVAADRIALTTLLPVGADPHTFAPSPQDAAAVADAHVVFVNGLGLEEFLKELIENAGGNAPVVITASGVETRALNQTGEHGGDLDAKEQEEAGSRPMVDPHVWMTPVNAVIMVHNIEQTVSALDPGNADIYRQNAAGYKAQLEELDAWVKEQINSISPAHRKMITDHDSFGYFAERYGLEVVGAIIPAYSTSAEPSAREIAALQDKIKAHDVRAVFVGMTVNPVLARQMTIDTQIKFVPLFTGSLGGAGSEAETYTDLIRYNTRAIVEALK